MYDKTKQWPSAPPKSEVLVFYLAATAKPVNADQKIELNSLGGLSHAAFVISLQLDFGAGSSRAVCSKLISLPVGHTTQTNRSQLSIA